MRVDIDPDTTSIQLLQQNRPCPRCQSERVTVRQERADGREVLRVACSDCSFAREVPAD